MVSLAMGGRREPDGVFPLCGQRRSVLVLEVDCGVVGGVVGPAAPEDAGPSGSDSSEGPMVLLAACTGLVVGVACPFVFPDRFERPPVDCVPHVPVRFVAEPDGAGATRRTCDRGGAGLGEQRVRAREPGSELLTG